MPTPLEESVSRRLFSNVRLLESAVLVKYGPPTVSLYAETSIGPEIRTDIKVLAAPVSGQERELAPEGLRESDMRKFYSDADVSSIYAHEKDGDTILWGGKSWRVYLAQRWGAFSVLSTAAYP